MGMAAENRVNERTPQFGPLPASAEGAWSSVMTLKMREKDLDLYWGQDGICIDEAPRIKLCAGVPLLEINGFLLFPILIILLADLLS